MVRPGEEVVVAGLRGGWGLQRRLADMGFVPGVNVKVTHSQGPGPIVVNLRGSRVALGFGVASRIMVNGREQRDA
jgi:Fe2+ transport system protein FeoA